jgi:hypothetical protein
MTVSERLNKLHPDIIKNYLDTGKSEGIPQEVKKYIDLLDRVPDLYRRYSSPTKTARELQKLYPDDFRNYQTARSLVYAAINHFHLNNTVKNEAWDNLYADQLDELSRICVKKRDFGEAKRCLIEAHRIRTSRSDDIIDPDILKPITEVLSPEVPAEFFGIEDEYDLKTLWVKKKETYDAADKFVTKLKGVNDHQKKDIMKEVGLNLNISEAQIIEDGLGDN